MPQTDTAAVLAAIDACRKRAIWAADFAFLNKDRPGKTRMEMREIRADLATDSARDELAQIAADVPLLAAVARAAAELVQAATDHDPKWLDELRANPRCATDTAAVALDVALAALAALATGAGTGTGDNQ